MNSDELEQSDDSCDSHHAVDGDDDTAIVPSLAEVGWIGTSVGHPARRRDKTFIPVMAISLLLHTTAFAALIVYGARYWTPPALLVDAGTGAETGERFATFDATEPLFSAAALPPIQVNQETETSVHSTNERPVLLDEQPELPEEGEFSFEVSAIPLPELAGASDSSSRQLFGIAASTLSPPKRGRTGPSGLKGGPVSGDLIGVGASDSASGADVPGSGNGIAAGPPIPDSGNRPPAYPREALRRRWEGTVVLGVEVLPSGATGRVEITRSSGYALLDTAAVDAVRQWRFHAANGSEGRPLDHSCNVTLPVAFVLRSPTRG